MKFVLKHIDSITRVGEYAYAKIRWNFSNPQLTLSIKEFITIAHNSKHIRDKAAE